MLNRSLIPMFVLLKSPGYFHYRFILFAFVYIHDHFVILNIKAGVTICNCADYFFRNTVIYCDTV